MSDLLYYIYLKAFYVKTILCSVFCPRRPIENVVDLSNLPWLWIGAETSPGNFVSVTDIINSRIEKGTVVTPEWLEYTTVMPDIISWRYLDSATLNESEFPLTGLIIPNDTFESRN